MPGGFKGTAFRKNRMGGYMLAYYGQFKNYIFWLSLKQKLLYAHTETALNGEISPESVYISVKNNTNFKKNLVSFYLNYMGQIKLKNHLTLLSL